MIAIAVPGVRMDIPVEARCSVGVSLDVLLKKQIAISEEWIT